ncbi:MAG: NAD-dependent epimerase/dehydratase family protein [Hyphomicrobiales bacterium]|nr:MAG: NAD-dependent epimerase/dehydratase family protein [Hyphomicrobiales bacterium]
MAKGKVVILGINGHIGQAAARAFVAAGWDVTGMGRTDKYRTPGVRFVTGDSDSVAETRRAIGDAAVVVNALNLPYAAWDKGRKEALMGRVLEAMGTTGKTMLFPGNIYNFSRTDRVVTPDLAQRPETPRGAIRVRVEQMLEAATARGDLQVIILRAGDFYGPGSSGDWFDQAILSAKGKVQIMGAPGAGHSWAYLPDLARAFEALAAVRGTLGVFERFHFAGNYVTGDEMAAAIVRAAPVPLKVTRFPMWLLAVMGLVSPLMREIGKMAYLWRNSMELRDGRLDELLGPDFSTPFESAVAATVAPFFAGETARAMEPATALRG